MAFVRALSGLYSISTADFIPYLIIVKIGCKIYQMSCKTLDIAAIVIIVRYIYSEPINKQKTQATKTGHQMRCWWFVFKRGKLRRVCERN